MLTKTYNSKTISSKKSFQEKILGLSTVKNIPIRRNAWNRCWIWKVLLICGFSSRKHTSRFAFLTRKLMSFLFLHARAFFSILLLARTGTFTKSSVAAIIMNTCSVLLWYSMQFAESHGPQLYSVIRKLRKINEIKEQKENRKTNLSLIFVLSLPFVFAASMVKSYSLKRSASYAQFWLIGVDFEDDETKELSLMFLSALVYFSVFLNSSILVVAYISFCRILNNCIDSTMIKYKPEKSLIDALKVYRCIIECCELLENCFTAPISIVLLQFSAGIFMAVSLLLGFSVNPGTVVLQEVILVLSVCTILFTCAIVSAAHIPDSMKKGKLRFMILYQEELAKSVNLDFISKKRLTFLKALSNIKVFNFTACNTLYMSKTLLINSLGCFLTYGFLLIQLNSIQVPKNE